MDPSNLLPSVQGLQLLVYTAAESGGQQFLEMVLNSSAGRVVFDAYKNTLPLPETVARVNGYENTAQFLESINKRYFLLNPSENLRKRIFSTLFLEMVAHKPLKQKGVVFVM